MRVNKKIETILKQSGLPVAHLAFKKYLNTTVPNPPYICYKILSGSTEGPDSKPNLLMNKTVRVELYTDGEADPSVEQIVEECLSPFDYEQTVDDYLESEDLHLTAYEFDLYE